MLRRLFALPTLASLVISGWLFVVVLASARLVGDPRAVDAALLISGIVGLFAWIGLYIRHEHMMYAPPRPPDLPAQTQASAPRQELKLTVRHGANHTQVAHNVPMDVFQLEVVVQALLNGDNFAWDRWVGRSSGKEFTESQYKAIRDALITRLGILEWVDQADRSRGLKLTPAGKLWCREVISTTPPPHSLVEIIWT